MKDRALIGLLCQNLNPVPFYNHCKDMPVRIIKFKAGGIDWKKKRLNGIHFGKRRVDQGGNSYA